MRCTSGIVAAIALLAAAPAWAQFTNYEVGYRTNSGTVTLSSDPFTVGSGTSNYFLVGVGYNSASGTAILDTRPAASVTIDVGKLFVGVSTNVNPTGPGTSTNGGTGTGTLQLGTTSSITATTFVIGGSDLEGNAGVNPNNSGTVTTADGGITTINTPSLIIGNSKGNSGTFTLGANATLNLGSTGNRTALDVGVLLNNDNNTNRTVSGVMNLGAGGGVANLRLQSLRLSYNQAGITGGTRNGTLTLSSNPANVLDVSGSGTVVEVGVASVASGTSFSAGTMTGVLTIGNLDSSSVVESTDNSTAILVGSKPVGSTAAVNGTLDFKAGSLTIKTTGAGIAGGGGNTSRLNLGETGNVTLKAGASSSDWINGLAVAEIKSAGATIDTNGFVVGASQAFSGAGGLTKAGVGTLTLSGTNSYTGTTSVDAGVLEVAAGGSLSNSSGLTLNGGTLRYNSATTYTGSFTPASGTIGGTNLEGSFGGLSIGSGLTLSPGNSPGTASTDSQTWAGGGTYLWEINSTGGSAGFDPGWDLLSGSDTLTVLATSASKFTIAITSLDLANDPGSLFDFDDETSYAWKIADFANPVSGFDSNAFLIDTNGFANAFTGSFGLALGTSVAGGDATEVYVTYAAVPEPATFGLLAVAAGLAIALRRRS